MITTVLARKKQDELVKGMNSDLRKVYSAIIKEFDGLIDTNIMARYRIGCHVSAVTNNERKYGEAAVSTLAQSLGGTISDTMLWEFRQLANAFSEKMLEDILAKKTTGDRRITYNHLRLLSGLRPDTRKAMLKKMFVEDLTTDELMAAIQAKHGGKRSKGGRGITPPKTINAGLNQISKLSSDVHKRMAIWDKAVFDKLVKGPADDIDSDALKVIGVTHNEVSAMVSDGQKLLASLEKSGNRVKDVLTARKNKGSSSSAPVKKKVAKKKVAVKKHKPKSKRTGVTSTKAKIAKAKAKRKASSQPLPA